MTQPTLFDLPPAVPVAPACIPEPERKRLSAQCQTMLARLQCGPVTNQELMQIACKYTSRISDLRKAGYNVKMVDKNAETGLTRYELVPG